MTVTDYSDKTGHLLMFRKKQSRGFSWDWTQGAWLPWLFGYSKNAKDPRVLIHYSAEASLLLKLLPSCLISELQGSKIFFSPSVKILWHLLHLRHCPKCQMNKISGIHSPFQKLVNFFCKKPDSKCFRICGPYSLCDNHSTLNLVQKQP